MNTIQAEAAQALRSAATSHASALDAMRDDVTANISALHKGKLRQLSNNSAELMIRFGEMAAMLELARKHLPADEIRTIVEDAARHAETTEEKP